MRVCILGQYPPHIGGVSSHTYLLSQELVKRGDEVYVLTYPHPDVKDLGPVKVETAPAPNIKGLRGLFFFVSAFFKLRSMIRRYQIDLIHAHFLLPPGLIGVYLGSWMGKETAVTAHGSDLMIQANNPLLQRLIRSVLKKADYVMVVNNDLKDKVLKMGINPEKVYVTPNAIDTERFNPQKTELPPDIKMRSDKPTVLFVGNLVYQKGVKYLLEAKKLMKTDVELLIVGDGPLRPELEKKVEDDKISDVVFTGARRDVEDIMPSASVFVLPSISEGFPITILEAMASGLPVVATSVGGIGEVMNDMVGSMVKPAEPLKLARALDEILQNEELRQEKGVAAREHSRKYSTLKIPY
ncbi:glycosyltransferase [Methanobacterium sp. 42_16]|uniref:glycosyltransferase n=1 Tax=Methanobacterium sp. 42_16 TaxID=1641383 RepID=UPI000748DCBB|nr:glycosyltransferase [Methanobacterium sp. 42_16]KUK71936.1 MAG: Group 1 glycosyl transferase [Methanobacterium sp. 42_16]